MSWLCRLLAVAAAVLVSSPAVAQDATVPAAGAQHLPGDSVSYSTWAIDRRVVRLQVKLPASEANKLVGPHAPPPDTAAVADAIAAAFSARSGAGPCAVVDQGEGEGEIYRLALTPGIDRFEMIFLCPSPDRIMLSDTLLFDRVPRHIDFARVQSGADPPFVELFTGDHRAFGVQAAQDGGPPFAFLRQGTLNLLRHADLLAILAGIVLFCARRRDLVVVAGSIALGEGVAAGLTLEGLALEWPALAGAAAGLFVAGLGAAALRSRNAGRPLTHGWKTAVGISLALAAVGAIAVAGRGGPVAGWAVAGTCLVCLAMFWGARATGSPHWLLWFPAGLLGLVNGLAIGTYLAVLSMPPMRIAGPLAGWMTGATIGATVCAALAMFILWLIERRWPVRGALVKEIIGAALIGLGLFWFVSRVWT